MDASGDAYVAGGTASTNFPTTIGAFQTALGSGAVSNAFVFELNPDGSSLTYCTYLGGTGDDVALGIALDSSGNVYTVGQDVFHEFPHHESTSGIPGRRVRHEVELFRQRALVYSTYLGGSSTGDCRRAVALDSSDNAYVTGQTSSSSFPTTTGAFQTTLRRSFRRIRDGHQPGRKWLRLFHVPRRQQQ